MKTIARPCSSQAATESASRIEPPGWTTAVTPARAASSTLSRKGKKASEASTAPRLRSPALRTAMCTESTRLIWPAPTEQELADLRFAWLVCKHVKSNAIVLAKGGMLVGVGAGQMSRVDSVGLAVRKSGGRHVGSVLASDAFFPFRDNIDEAARAGVVAIAQPGGSVRDADSVAACDEHGLAMIFTGVRHFRH